MNILEKIVARKKEEIAIAKAQISKEALCRSAAFARKPLSFREFLLAPDRTGIIAEFKRRSPSKGLINGTAGVADVTRAYNASGASALSVLTDTDFFGGTAKDLIAAREANDIPVLRKDFMIDPYQVYEARAMGADMILLIAAILNPAEIESLSNLAKELDLNVLLEVHNLEELERSLVGSIDAVGVNNRNLADFSVDIRTSFDLVNHIPNDYLKVSESAISAPETIGELRAAGFQGFLIGENFMKTADPGAAARDFMGQL
ncbi:indole-3-glycerol phosphate synthase TrpC [Pedobacter yulinensis]|uniref:Indole-3-glycerol phosphate synthase n=1 Tax=Pedobacter yulinensis TaxID=2126353 RepID=A0A2T3HRV6_9SPHI|nr:indole-3-glycerol phosphate synthase TrpC [Pedobacter yulinensis]PST85200.1 indole-3-glycerol phosphate synthase TrpC [Pedobacter yulinensis]